MKAGAACILLVYATVISANLILYDVFHKYHFRPAKLWDASLGQFPYYVHIIPQKSSPGEYVDANLGGVIIDKLWVLTLASATIGVSQLKMLFGVVRLSKAPKLTLTSTTWVIHPQFNVNDQYWQTYDICLVRLPQELSFDKLISPTRLESSTPIFIHPGLEFVTCSYERTQGGLSLDLKWTFVILAKLHACDNMSTTVDPSLAECTRLYPMSKGLKSKNYCQWDRGGPLIYVADDGATTLIGMSPGPHGPQCDSKTPKAYISISTVYGWITWTMSVFPTSETPETSSILKTTKLLTSPSPIENDFIAPISNLPKKPRTKFAKKESHSPPIKTGLDAKKTNLPAIKTNLPAIKTDLPAIKTDLPAAEPNSQGQALTFSTLEPKRVYINVLREEQLEKLYSFKQKTEEGPPKERDYVYYFWPHKEPEEAPSNTDLPIKDTDLRTTETNLPTTETELPTTETDLRKTETDLPQNETDLPKTETDLPQSETDFSKTETNLPTTETDFPTITDLPTVKTDFPATKTDLPAIKTDLPTIKTDLPTNKTDLHSTKTFNLTAEVITKGSKRRRMKLKYPITSTKRPTIEQYLPSPSSKEPTKIKDDPKVKETPKDASDFPSTETNTAKNESNISNLGIPQFVSGENAADEPFFVLDDVYEVQPTPNEAHHHRVKREVPKPKQRDVANRKNKLKPKQKAHPKKQRVARNDDPKIEDADGTTKTFDKDKYLVVTGIVNKHMDLDYIAGNVPTGSEDLATARQLATNLDVEILNKHGSAEEADNQQSYTERSSYTLMIGNKPKKINLNVDVKLLMNDKDRMFSIGR